MDLYALRGHNVRFVFVNGSVIDGYVHTYISAEDNDPDPESVLIDCPWGSAGGYLEIAAVELREVVILD